MWYVVTLLSLFFLNFTDHDRGRVLRKPATFDRVTFTLPVRTKCGWFSAIISSPNDMDGLDIVLFQGGFVLKLT